MDFTASPSLRRLSASIWLTGYVKRASNCPSGGSLGSEITGLFFGTKKLVSSMKKPRRERRKLRGSVDRRNWRRDDGKKITGARYLEFNSNANSEPCSDAV